MSIQSDAIARVRNLLDTHFHGDWEAMFDHYAIDGMLGVPQLADVLYDAGVGNRLIVKIYARAIVSSLDGDGDGSITLAELRAAIGGPCSCT